MVVLYGYGSMYVWCRCVWHVFDGYRYVWQATAGVAHLGWPDVYMRIRILLRMGAHTLGTCLSEAERLVGTGIQARRVATASTPAGSGTEGTGCKPPYDNAWTQ